MTIPTNGLKIIITIDIVNNPVILKKTKKYNTKKTVRAKAKKIFDEEAYDKEISKLW